MSDELTKALLLEEAATPRMIAGALFASVTGHAPFVQSLVETGAINGETLARYVGRGEAPFLRQVAPVAELLARLPPGLCNRLFAIPVRHDAITGTIDVVVADATDLHPAVEIGFHLGAPVRLVRAPAAAIDEVLRRLRNDALRQSSPTPEVEDDRLYDSRPRAYPQVSVAPVISVAAMPSAIPRRPSLALQPDSAPPPPDAPVERPAQAGATRSRTPPWGTPVHSLPPSEADSRGAARSERPAAMPALRSELPPGGHTSEMPIPLTRKTHAPANPALHMFRGGTQRPPPQMIDPGASRLGEGQAFDTAGLRDVVERPGPRIDSVAGNASAPPLGSFIPGPPPVPASLTPGGSYAAFAPHAAQGQFGAAEISGVIAAMKAAGSRDEILELVLTGARLVAVKVALFVVKKGGYLGWMCTPEFAERSALQSVLVPLEESSIFDRAIREDIYLGPVRYDDIHAPLLRILRNPSRDVAVVPIRVSGRTAVIIVADDLGDTMIGTRRLEELARAAGDAFARIVRTRR